MKIKFQPKRILLLALSFVLAANLGVFSAAYANPDLEKDLERADSIEKVNAPSDSSDTQDAITEEGSEESIEEEGGGENETSEDLINAQSEDEEILPLEIISGSFGEWGTWSFGNGILTVNLTKDVPALTASHTGDTESVEALDGKEPEIKSVIIQGTAKSLGKYFWSRIYKGTTASEFATNIQSVVLPEGLTNIDANALPGSQK